MNQFHSTNVKILTLCFSIILLFSNVLAKSGDVDSSFGNNGYVNFQPNFSFSPTCMKVQADGKILVGGYQPDETGYTKFALARFNQNGSIDYSFGINGSVVTNVSSVSEELTGIAIQSNGRIVAVGYGTFGDEIDGFTDDVIVARYNSNGSLDPSFGDAGLLNTTVGTDSDVANSAAIQPNGKIVVTGSTGNGIISDMVVLRYNSNGSPDNTFNSNGKAVLSTLGFDFAKTVRLQSDGKIVIGGTKLNSIEVEDNDFVVARLNANGSIDNSFGTNGFYTKSIGVNDFFGDLQIADNGDLLISGNSGDSESSSLSLIRLNSSGTENLQFGNQGIVLTNVSSRYNHAGKLTLQNNKIVVSGDAYSTETGNEIILVRYKHNGSLDNSFGTNGVVKTDLGFGSALSIELQNNRLILLTLGSFNLIGVKK
jgi:uncharacterized delta-60 repeat protein